MWRETFIHLAYASAATPIILYFFLRRFQHGVKCLVPYFWLSFFGAFYEFIITDRLHVNSTIWFKSYSLLEFLCLYYFFRCLLERRSAIILNSFLASFIAVFIFLQICWLKSGEEKTDSYLAVLETLFAYVGSFIWFRSIFLNMDLTTLWDSAVFYFISGFILYLSGTLFLFLMSDFVLTTEESGKHWIINVVLSILLNFVIIIGIWKGHQKSHQYSG
jgi:hypothetical protein